MNKQDAFWLRALWVLTALMVTTCHIGAFDGGFQKEEPNPVKAVPPIYPLIAASSGQSGTVIVEVEVDQNGVVRSARSVSGSKLLQPAAEHSATQWLFNPAHESTGKRVATLTFVFNLVSGDPPSNELVPVFFPPYRVEIKGTKPIFVQRVDSDPPNVKPRKKPRGSVR
jgi:TonB family protein